MFNWSCFYFYFSTCFECYPNISKQSNKNLFPMSMYVQELQTINSLKVKTAIILKCGHNTIDMNKKKPNLSI